MVDVGNVSGRAESLNVSSACQLEPGRVETQRERERVGGRETVAYRETERGGRARIDRHTDRNRQTYRPIRDREVATKNPRQ